MFPVDRGHQSHSLSKTALRLLAPAQFQEQILKFFLDKRSAFFLMGLRPPRPDFPFPRLFPRFVLLLLLVCLCVCALWGARSTSRGRHAIPVAFGRSFFLNILFLFFTSIACVLNIEGPSLSFWESPCARERAMGVLLESISLVPPCTDSLRDCSYFPKAIQPLGMWVHRRNRVLLSRSSPLNQYTFSLMVLEYVEVLVFSDQFFFCALRCQFH